jgi:S-methyl-5-thioribose-1-phosphate isomerase
MKINGKQYRTVWFDSDSVKMIDQTVLPHAFSIVSFKRYTQVADAIKTMVVRGAPAIGAAGAYGLALAAVSYRGSGVQSLRKRMVKARELLALTRPTAHDLFDGLSFVSRCLDEPSVRMIKKKALVLAEEYAQRSIERCAAIGNFGAQLIRNGDIILTHCNAGALATVDIGTALAPMRTAYAKGKKIFVFVDETRPWLQGSRLTAWELFQEKIPHAVIADNAAGYYMHQGKISLCIVGADRIALNGDVANKIGTYEKAVLAKENQIPFYVAAPASTIDMNCPSGGDIPIEGRDPLEVTHARGATKAGKIITVRLANPTSSAFNPAFDVTPAKYITGIITENGIIKPGDIKRLR